MMVTTEQGTTEVRVPDIGDYSDVPVIELLVRVGDAVNVDDPLVTLESDKATMDIPAPVSGSVTAVLVTVGDRVSEGSPIALVQPGDGALRQPPSLVGQQEPAPVVEEEPPTAGTAPASGGGAPAGVAGGEGEAVGGAHAGPGVRRLARELGVDLAAVSGTGPKGRITKEDLLASVRGPAGTTAPALAPSAAGAGIPPVPVVHFAKFGPVETQPLSRIQRLSVPSSTPSGASSTPPPGPRATG